MLRIVISQVNFKAMAKTVEFRSYSGMLRFFLFLAPLVLLACTKTCVGLPEVGSKQRPVRFYMDGWSRKEESLETFRRLSSCMENASGYRVSFEIAADEKAVASALGRAEAQFGSMSALGYVEAQTRYPLQSLLVVLEKGAPSTRSVILGKTTRWKSSLQTLGIPLSAPGLRNESSLLPIDGHRFAYLSPDSDVGFFVPRQLLFQRNIFPEEVLFAGSFPLILQAIERDMVVAGAVSESFVEQSWPHSTPVQLSLPLGNFVVLAISQGLPGKVIAARKDLPEKMVSAVTAGLAECSKDATLSDIQKIFNGDGFLQSQDKMFDFIKELQQFQQEHVRVLSPQK